MKLVITLSFARLLQSVIAGELNYADFSPANRKILQQFIDDNVLDYRIIGKQQKRISCPDDGNLARYLHHKFEIPSLANYIAFLESTEFQRSDAVHATSDSKIRKTVVLKGFMINCYETIHCKLRDQPFAIQPLKGAYSFVTDFSTFTIPENTTVVIVENHENFREIERQRYLFDKMNPLFVWRYQNSNSIVEWIKSIPNSYIHFGDFDLKGIHIYLSEFKEKIGGHRGNFLIPPNIEHLISLHGQRSLFIDQERFLPAIEKRSIGELQGLLDLILKEKKGLAQEILINPSPGIR